MDKNFIQNSLSLRGQEVGQKWLDLLTEIIKKYENKWRIKSVGTFPNLSINYVEKARTDNHEDVVLKIGFPGDEEFLSEIAALTIYKGEGSVKVLEKNPEDCVLLLERCMPGDSLDSLNNEEEEILIFAETCKKIWKKIPDNSKFKYLSGESKYFNWYFENYERARKFLPGQLVNKAKEKFEYLIDSQGELFLLHSDLHHNNILSSARGWLAIDPKGLIGERQFELSTFIINPYKRFKDNELLITSDFFKRRIELLAKTLGFDKQRITGWAFVKIILVLIWFIQDHNKGDKIGLKTAMELEKLL